ncbi:hypothetical protein P153DRAFT_91838 [Dothidotthia symphoricarpi CBS 119687]|uniref:Secreted protein n=1 Tax=Dothidotthia symphoricarpi CBS 119687 TaxID=1392245 RepID=A0A6A6A1J9_9PLEO|nr:uncharacterized protein P153DRAFT_91838 [Dothidotthia symphoricarpi CBS 119687]KAF2125719.1 hypothetical protein P153DRAFT_91838 [Dothidotthia symphoricarpi CBS 119687]
MHVRNIAGPFISFLCHLSTSTTASSVRFVSCTQHDCTRVIEIHHTARPTTINQCVLRRQPLDGTNGKVDE